MKKMIVLFALLLVSLISAWTIPEQTNITLTDLDGKKYDIDALLNEGKHLFLHQMYGG